MTDYPEKKLELLIDQAVREFPLEPAPAGLKAEIMRQIEAPRQAARFQFSWFDLTLSGLLALVIGFALDSFQGIVRSPYWSARFRVEVILVWQDIKIFLQQNQAPIAAALLSAGMVFLLAAVLASVYWRHTAYANRLPA